MNYQHLNVNKDQNSFKDSFKKLNNVSDTKINYIQSNSYNNFVKDKKMNIKNNINNSSFKHLIQKKNSKLVLLKNLTNKKLNNQASSLLNYMPKDSYNSKLSKINFANSDSFESDNKNNLQNKILDNENINIIYIKNKFNIIRNNKYKIPIPTPPFSNKNIINEERKNSLQINLKNKFMNFKNQNIFNQKTFSINNYNLMLIRKNKYKTILERYKESNSFS